MSSVTSPFLQRLFGGNIVPQRRTIDKSNVKSNFSVSQWSISGTRAVDAARALMPYLKIKSVQAYLLSCFEYEAKWSKGGTNIKMPIAEFNRRESLVQEMRDFNGRAYLERA